jgi:hypothetical protein
MSTTQDLTFDVTFYSGDTKVARAEGNFLIPHCFQRIVDYFITPGQTFYTSLEVRQNNKLLLKEEITPHSSYSHSLTLLN